MYSRRRYTSSVRPRYTYGMGKYSIGKAWRKSGLGKSTASVARKLINAAGNRAVSAIAGRGMYTGRGAYTTNALVKSSAGSLEVPEFRAGRTNEVGAILVSRREFIRDIYGPVSADGSASLPWEIQSLSINPGLETSFPWLSQIAQNYDEYSFKQLIFTYRSTVTDVGNSSNGQCGTVIMAVDYNAAHPAFDNKQTMMEYIGAMSAKTTKSLLCGVECDPRKLVSDQFFVRANPVVVKEDAKTYDHGLFQLALANVPTELRNQALGELWVSYTVELRKPKFYSARGLNISQDIFVASNTSYAPKLLLGTDTTRLSGQQNNIGCLVQSVTSGSSDSLVITFPHHYTGYVSIRYTAEQGDATANPNGMVGWFTNGETQWTIATGCNITTIADIYGSGDSSTPNPSYACSGAQTSKGISVAHFLIGAANPGKDNVITFKPTSNVNFCAAQSELLIAEFNGGFSSKFQGSGTSDAPVLVNSAGTVITV